MLSSASRFSWLAGGWVAAVASIATASIAMRASVTTTAVLVALGITPGIVVGVLAYSAPSATVAEIIHSVETKDAR